MFFGLEQQVLIIMGMLPIRRQQNARICGIKLK